MNSSVGQLLLNRALPEGLRQERHQLDKKSIHLLMDRLAKEHPDQYRETLKKLSDLGRDAAWESGASVSLSGLRKSAAKERVLGPLRQQLQQLLDDPSQDQDPDSRDQRIIDMVLPNANPLIQAISDEAKAENSPYHLQIASGGRGKASDLNSLRGADLLATDTKNRPIPIPVLSSYADGFDPVEWFAGSFSQRKNAISTKLATADAGFATKRLVAAAHRQVVNKEAPDATRLPVGLPVEVGDRDNIGAVLAADAGPYKAGSVITPQVQEALRDAGVEDLLIHSPMTELSQDGGISRWAAGRRDRHGLSRIGDNIGVASAQTIGEKLSQGMLQCLAVGTRVRMADWSTKAIEDIRTGDFVLGADAQGHSFPTRVSQTFDQGVQRCQRYTFVAEQSHTERVEIVATKEHKLLVNVKKWSSSHEAKNRELQVLPVGSTGRDFNAIRPSGFDDADSSFVHEPAAGLLGALIGDGCFTESVNGVFFSCADPSFVRDLEPDLHARGWALRLHSTKEIYYRLQDSATGRSKPPLDWVKQLGLHGKYAHEKVLPVECFHWDNHSVAHLLGGLFAADGCVHTHAQTGRPAISFGVTSRKLVEQVKELLDWRFGINTGIIGVTEVPEADKIPHTAREYGVFYRNYPIYTLRIANFEAVCRFANLIRLYGVKAGRLDTLIAASRPIKGDFRFRKCRRLVEKPSAGDLQTFDIEVEHPDHLFVLANGLIVSNSKHQSLLGKSQRATRSGMAYLNRLLDGPENFPEAGPLAEHGGTVKSVTSAPQGGHEVVIGDQSYFVGADLGVQVKPGDSVEQGDDLSDGVPHPRDLVRLRGLGQARRDYTRYLQEGLADSGVEVGRRTVESTVAGLLNWARVTTPEGIEDATVDEIVPANRLMARYKPRPDSTLLGPGAAVGRYLEEPVLHYTPGTLVTNRVARELTKWKVPGIQTHQDAPGFEPHMERSVMAVYHDPDWQTRLSGFYTSGSLLESLHRGRSSDTKSTSYIPGLVQGKGFGDALATQGHYGALDTPTPGALPGAMDPVPAQSLKIP